MLILLEGPDASGKSTLATQLAEALRAVYPSHTVNVMHKGPPTTHPLAEYENPLFTYRPGTGQHIICDRWHVGEYVYPSIFGRGTQADTAVMRHIDAFLNSRGAVVVHMNIDRERHRNLLETRGDDVVSVDMLDRIRERFTEYLMTHTTLPVLGITHHDSPFNIESIITLARTFETTAAKLNSFITYVGPTSPRYLLVGDVRHAVQKMLPTNRDFAMRYPTSTLMLGPTFGPYRATSGHFLLDVIPDKMWREGVGIANANDVDDFLTLRRTLGNPQTVALGRNAWRTITSLGVISAGAVPHAQYVRRFHHGYNRDYGELIYTAAILGENLLSWRP